TLDEDRCAPGGKGAHHGLMRVGRQRAYVQVAGDGRRHVLDQDRGDARARDGAAVGGHVGDACCRRHEDPQLRWMMLPLILVNAELVSSTPADPSILSSVPPLTSNDVPDSSLISVPALSSRALAASILMPAPVISILLPF